MMRSSTLLLQALAAGHAAFAYPGMGAMLNDLNNLDARQIGVPGSTQVLIGDLAKTGPTTPVGTEAANCLTGVTGCEDDTSVGQKNLTGL